MKTLLLTATAIIFSNLLLAQSYDKKIAGVWKGTSLCQVKDSPCHDEQVVYYVTKNKIPNGFSFRATKMVNGKEEEMGTLEYTFDPKTQQLTSTPRQNVVWKLKLTDKKLDGTLHNNGQLYRIVAVSKVK